MRRQLIAFTASVAAIVAALQAAPLQPVKIAFYNIRSGEGIQPLRRHRVEFAETVNCDPKNGPVNAWGVGIVQRELTKSIANDEAVIALGLAEAWNCAAPSKVREALGWKADSGEHNGTALAARYGFKGRVDWLQLDTSRNRNPRDTMWVARGRVCVTPSCEQSLDVYTTHWSGSGVDRLQIYDQQARDTLRFMEASVGPRVLVGDLNVFEGNAPVCDQTPNNTTLKLLRSAGYVDAWPAVHRDAEGYTGMVNRAGCGTPEGYVWKRIDYAWSRELTPVDVVRFGVRPPGDAAPSDHLGLIATYHAR
jgi:endonuclease/exonuclease/phosphatase family metal-dependent hydrolase